MSTDNPLLFDEVALQIGHTALSLAIALDEWHGSKKNRAKPKDTQQTKLLATKKVLPHVIHQLPQLKRPESIVAKLFAKVCSISSNLVDKAVQASLHVYVTRGVSGMNM